MTTRRRSRPFVSAVARQQQLGCETEDEVTGKPILANDPHRAIQYPSVRKTVHLVGPGWNVIGAGEPALSGHRIGPQRAKLRSGFTIVGIDQQDVYVEKTNPDNPTEYLYKGEWKKFRIEHETIQVGGGGEEGMGASASRGRNIRFEVYGSRTCHSRGRCSTPCLLVEVGRATAWDCRIPACAFFGACEDWGQFQAAAAGYKVPQKTWSMPTARGTSGGSQPAWLRFGMDGRACSCPRAMGANMNGLGI